jgi:hypothetical protein
LPEGKRPRRTRRAETAAHPRNASATHALAREIDESRAIRGERRSHRIARAARMPARPSGHHAPMGRGALVIAAFVAAVSLAPSATASEPANIPWETYLPAMSSSNAVQPHGVPNCRKATVRCIDVEIRRLRFQQRRFGCDHRGVFATTYLELTRELRDTLRRRPRFFNDSKYLYVEDALFANIYVNTLRAYERDRPVDPAWQIALDTARSSNVNAAQDMLLGINAHVQNDMPFLLAALGQRTRTGATRKPDHDKMNEILDTAYERVVRQIEDRFDPIVATTNARWTFADDYAGLEMVKEWREQVWRNAERLLAAKDDQERAQVAGQIHQYAAGWAQMIANPIQVPAYRARRDAYCRTAMQSQP